MMQHTRFPLRIEGRAPVRSLTSHYGELTFYESQGGDNGVVAKAIMPWFFAKLDEDEKIATAAQINSSIQAFRQALFYAGVPLAQYEYGVTAEGHPNHVTPYLGESADELIQGTSQGERRRILRAVIASTEGVLRQKDPPTVGVDCQLSNFCMRNGEAIYIDVFPALIRRQDGTYLVHWPNPQKPEILAQEIERKFRARGSLRRLRFSLLRADPCLEDDLIVALRDVLGDFGQEMVEFFEGLPDNQAKYLAPRDLKDRIDALGYEDADAFRELALKLVPEGSDRETVFAQVFDLSSHYSSRGIPQEERFTELRRLLQGYVS